jgi:4-amino-4-deoxy-L-arabinose transferase-like glycosyltransferase
MDTSNPYVPAFFIVWFLLGGGGMLWISQMTNPAAKRTALRSLILVAVVLFASFAWLITRSPQGMLFMIPVLALIFFLNFKLVKVCDQCAAINRPQVFVAPTYCHKCGAKLP